MENQNMTLIGHLEDLRKGLIKCSIAIFSCFILVCRYSQDIISGLIKPIGKVVFISPQEALVVNIKVAFFTSLLFACPYIIYQVWQFVSTGLKADEKKYAYVFAPLSMVFFFVGLAFGFFVIVPIGMGFLLGFATQFVVPMISINNYISFIATLTLAFGVIFELPIAVLFLTKLGVATPGFLVKRRREAVVLIFIAAAFLTPPDVVTQILMAVPLLVLYEISIFFSKIAYKKKILLG